MKIKYSWTKSKGRIQFGGGELKSCLRDWHYKLGINGKEVHFRVAETEVNIPGLIGFDFMRKWDMILRLGRGTFTSHGEEREGIIQESPTSHPCIDIF